MAHLEHALHSTRLIQKAGMPLVGRLFWMCQIQAIPIPLPLCVLIPLPFPLPFPLPLPLALPLLFPLPLPFPLPLFSPPLPLVATAKLLSSTSYSVVMGKTHLQMFLRDGKFPEVRAVSCHGEQSMKA